MLKFSTIRNTWNKYGLLGRFSRRKPLLCWYIQQDNDHRLKNKTRYCNSPKSRPQLNWNVHKQMSNVKKSGIKLLHNNNHTENNYFRSLMLNVVIQATKFGVDLVFHRTAWVLIKLVFTRLCVKRTVSFTRTTALFRHDFF